MKIILVGFMGSGKSVIGKELAAKLHCMHYDLDNLIEKKVKMSVSDIFNVKGEIYFRKIENSIFTEMLKGAESFVISTGGGTPCYADNHLLLQNSDVISIYLSASINTLVTRLKSEKYNRPLIVNLNEEELLDFIAKSSFERSYFYLFAKHKISVDDKSVNSIVLEITAILNMSKV